MKVELNFNEEEVIQKLAQDELGQYTLQNRIVNEIKRQIVEITVKSIKEKLINLDWYGQEKDYFKDTIQKEVYASIEKKIENLIANKFSNTSIETMVNHKIDIIFDEFVEKKITEKLEQAKVNLQFYSLKEQKEQDDDEKEMQKAKIDEAYQQGLKDGYSHKNL